MKPTDSEPVLRSSDPQAEPVVPSDPSLPASRLGGPREFFWGTLAPLSVLAMFGSAVLVTVLAYWLIDLRGAGLFRLAGLTLGVGLALLLPILYYVVRTRLTKPMAQLEMELRGDLPWQPEGDVLFASLRRSAERVRTAARDNRLRAERDEERMADLRERLADKEAGEAFMLRVEEVVGSAETLPLFAIAAGQLVLEWWPAQRVVLLQLLDTEPDLLVLMHEAGSGQAPSGAAPPDKPRYRKASLPLPVKEAFRRGFYAEAGLPFSHDPDLPQARSFVALGLEHRGATVGVLYAASAELNPPAASVLLRARSLLSLGFSRALYRMEMEDAAIRDALTGVFTQDHFLSVTRRELARSNRYSRPVSCVVFDIDGLRRVNDAYGANIGDQLLGEIAKVVDEKIRSSDVLARITGGEFALLLPEASESAALTAAERVRSAVETHPFILQRSKVERVTVSAGIAIHPPHGVTALSLLDSARLALARAKEGGRNRVVLAPDETPEPL